MRFRILSFPILACLALTACKGAEDTGKPMDEVAKAPAGPTMEEACTIPTSRSSSPEETAWRIFVAINCESGQKGAPRVFQTWTEQYCLYNPDKCDPGDRARSPGGSLKARRAVLNDGNLSSECSELNLNPPWAPTNLNTAGGHKPVSCEEVFLNRAEMAYVRNPAPNHNLLTIQAQLAFVDYQISQGKTQDDAIDFPPEAIELKVDWLPADSLDEATRFNCDDPPKGLYTEEIDGTCYAMASMHLSSKLYPKWLWATWEPQYTGTNPNRCNDQLYSNCVDPWGSSPAVSNGSDTDQTKDLEALMNAAGLPAAFKNYRLTGAQIGFENDTMTKLGNSFTEWNAGVPPGEASCITCHNGAAFNKDKMPPPSSNKPRGSGAPPVPPMTGEPPPEFPEQWVRQDFSWFLGFMPVE